ncbi:MAG: diaminopimelate epimerase [Muribaculaceae bacterium]|jgi:diaminopimelate epimerase|nr:diaminopimelate epimerase [Muribaculaceae bacterium]
MKFYKYQGAGNDFLIADNRIGNISLTTEEIQRLCDRRYGIGADGLMLLELADGYDFKMVYYNSDGSGGMMCGNGGRCIVAFADRCGLHVERFIAADGPHEAAILSRMGNTLEVKLKMKDVDNIVTYPQPDINGRFLDTGTRHLVCPVDNIELFDVENEGRRRRRLEEFAPVGVNVNFIEREGEILKVRTFEKGVEAETYACGTGITASAIAEWHMLHTETSVATPVITKIKALRDELAVEFTPTPNGADDIHLIGPATFIAEIITA